MSSKTGCAAGLDWCAGGYRCHPYTGEHRGEPLSFPAPYGRLIATQVRRAGRDHVELLATIRLPAGEVRARDVARLLAVGVDLTIRAVLAGRLGRLQAAYHRLTGARVR